MTLLSSGQMLRTRPLDRAPEKHAPLRAVPGKAMRGMLAESSPIQLKLYTLSNMMDRMEQWQTLAAQALDANVFQDPVFVASSLLHTAYGAPPLFVVAELNCPDGPIWIGVLATMRHAMDRIMPVLRGWTSKQTALGAPLFHRDHASSAIAAILDWLNEDATAKNLLLPLMPMAGKTAPLLLQAAQARGFATRTFENHERAALLLSSEQGMPAENAIRRKKLKELRRLRKRLAEKAPLSFRDTLDPSASNLAIEAFLILESRGWKGERGTALVQEPGRAAFARTMLRSLAADGRLSIYGLYCGDQPIALGLVLGHGNRGFFWKIAIDESFVAFSPGVLFVQSLTDHLIAEGRYAIIDSCAIANHPMIDHLWKHRLPVADLLIGTRPDSGGFLALRLKESFWRHARARAKMLFNAMRGRKR